MGLNIRIARARTIGKWIWIGPFFIALPCMLPWMHVWNFFSAPRGGNQRGKRGMLVLSTEFYWCTWHHLSSAMQYIPSSLEIFICPQFRLVIRALLRDKIKVDIKRNRPAIFCHLSGIESAKELQCRFWDNSLFKRNRCLRKYLSKAHFSLRLPRGLFLNPRMAPTIQPAFYSLSLDGKPVRMMEPSISFEKLFK